MSSYTGDTNDDDRIRQSQAEAYQMLHREELFQKQLKIEQLTSENEELKTKLNSEHLRSEFLKNQTIDLQAIIEKETKLIKAIAKEVRKWFYAQQPISCTSSVVLFKIKRKLKKRYYE